MAKIKLIQEEALHGNIHDEFAKVHNKKRWVEAEYSGFCVWSHFFEILIFKKKEYFYYWQNSVNRFGQGDCQYVNDELLHVVFNSSL